jgi:hypothetical protein
MANVIVNSLLRELLTELGHNVPRQPSLSVPAANVSRLLAEIERIYPGTESKLGRCSVAIDGDIYTEAMNEPLDGMTEVVFIPPIEAG